MNSRRYREVLTQQTVSVNGGGEEQKKKKKKIILAMIFCV